MADPTKDENLADLKRQAEQTNRAEPPFPKLGPLTRGFVRADMQRVFDLFDQQVAEWQRRKQTSEE